MKVPFAHSEKAASLRDCLWLARGGQEFFDILRDADPRIRITPPASLTEIGQVEAFVGCPLPESLRAFWLMAGSLDVDHDCIVAKPMESVRFTTELRAYSHFMPMDHLLFVGALGDGDMFAFGVTKERKWCSDVFWWEHESDSRSDCGLGMWGYVANHVSWRLIDAPK